MGLSSYEMLQCSQRFIHVYEYQMNCLFFLTKVTIDLHFGCHELLGPLESIYMERITFCKRSVFISIVTVRVKNDEIISHLKDMNGKLETSLPLVYSVEVGCHL